MAHFLALQRLYCKIKGLETLDTHLQNETSCCTCRSVYCCRFLAVHCKLHHAQQVRLNAVACSNQAQHSGPCNQTSIVAQTVRLGVMAKVGQSTEARSVRSRSMVQMSQAKHSGMSSQSRRSVTTSPAACTKKNMLAVSKSLGLPCLTITLPCWIAMSGCYLLKTM